MSGAGPAASAAAGTNAARLIELEHVSRRYTVGDAVVHALDDVCLSIERAEFVAVMGPSGSGKSTLLNVVGCLDTPTSGIYRLGGEPVQGLSEDAMAAVRQRRVGFIFQAYHLVPRMTAARNVELPMLFAGLGPAARHERVAAALDAVGMSHRRTHRPAQLSGGERQRVAIARAIVMDPEILLADEPTGNLDTQAGDDIVALLESLHQRGLTVVLVTHDPRVGAHAERTLHMRDGRVETVSAGLPSDHRHAWRPTG